MRNLIALALTQIALVALSGAAWAIGQPQMDQLHNFFCNTMTAAGGILIAIGQPPQAISAAQQKMAQMISVCQVQRTHEQYAAVINIDGAGCPIGYFSEATLHPQPDGSVATSTVERNILGSVDAKVLTGLSQYSATTSGNSTTNNVTGAYTIEVSGQHRYVEAVGGAVVTVQINSAYSGVNSVNNGIVTQTITSDKEDYAINLGGQTYTAESLLNGTQTTCMLNGASASCSDFNYVMCVNQ